MGTVFQRLYDDALHRVDRLEKLRDKHQYATPSTNGSAVVEDTVDAAAAAVAAAAAAAEGSVLAAVEQSPLRGLRKMFSGQNVATDPDSSPLPPRQQTLSSSMSLPMLHHSPSLHKNTAAAVPFQSVTTLNFDFGNSRAR